DLIDVPEEIKNDIDFIYVGNMDEVLASGLEAAETPPPDLEHPVAARPRRATGGPRARSYRHLRLTADS
ncbi:MAG: hypothetical protein ABIJ56_04280, partial [Pseudomonadota bacterium]